VDAAADLMRLVNGYQVTQAIHVAAVLGVSDHLADGPKSADDLAAATGCEPRTLRRLMRALAAVGVYGELPDGRYQCTALGDELRTDGDRTLAGWARFVGRPPAWQAWSALLHSVRTGENAFRSVHGVDVWEYRARDPADSAAFDAAMIAMSRHVSDAVLDAYDFSIFKRVADVAGGRGALLGAILARHPGSRGVLIDQPHVIAGAGPVLAQAGVADRCDVLAADIFTGDLPAADAYVLKSIIHDWRDDEAVAILRNCRRAMGPEATLLMVERALPETNAPDAALAYLADLNMLVGPGGQERTPSEYGELLGQAGLRLTRVVPVARGWSVVEAQV
jgi:O-methyltransferase domain/Dimerisation domain